MQTLNVGPFTFEESGWITARGRRLDPRGSPKMCAVLRYLAERANTFVTYVQLEDQFWPRDTRATSANLRHTNIRNWLPRLDACLFPGARNYLRVNSAQNGIGFFSTLPAEAATQQIRPDRFAGLPEPRTPSATMLNALEEMHGDRQQSGDRYAGLPAPHDPSGAAPAEVETEEGSRARRIPLGSRARTNGSVGTVALERESYMSPPAKAPRTADPNRLSRMERRGYFPSSRKARRDWRGKSREKVGNQRPTFFKKEERRTYNEPSRHWFDR